MMKKVVCSVKRKRRKRIKVEPRFYVIMTSLAVGIITLTGRAIQTPAKTEELSTKQPQMVEEIESEIENDKQINETLEKNLSANEVYAINLSNNSRIFNNFYNDIVGAIRLDEMTALVNKNYKLPEDYKPTDLVVTNVAYSNDVLGEGQTMLRKEAAIQAEKMFAQAKREGVILLARSGFRSYRTQEQLYQGYVNRDGVEAADTYSARAGHSEHQLGLALDITSDSVNRELTIEFGKTKEGKWLKEHAYEFGFIIRFPEGKEHLTGFQYEPWHVRYVGIEAAKKIYKNDWLLEDYLLMQKDYN